ncbi:hypothetical protein HDU97_010386 [Phlyctochytrium planicorne]|nr:hypothetical protein HDU97_010386 [Phlyctochytrium planicorne]
MSEVLKRCSSPFIHGRFLEPAIHDLKLLYTLVNPSTRLPLSKITEAGVSDVHAAVDSAQNAFQGEWSKWEGSKRRDAMLRLADAMEANAEDLALAEALTGKPISDARADVTASIDCMRFFAVLATWKLAPALASGNTCILKPARQTPLSSLLLASIASSPPPSRSSSTTPILPPGVLNVIPGGASVGETLVKHAKVNKISFTGSTKAGRMVGSAAVTAEPGIRRTTLELGGKNVVIVCEDADLENAVGHVIEASFSNAGQNCCAGSRLLLQESIAAKFTDMLVDRVRTLKIGDPLEETTQIGPLVDEQAMAKVQDYIAKGIADKIPLVYGGSRVGTAGNFIQPTTIERSNSSPYGLAAGVMTRSIATSETFISNLSTGFVWVNSYNLVPSFLPLGGVKESGGGGGSNETTQGKEASIPFKESTQGS